MHFLEKPIFVLKIRIMEVQAMPQKLTEAQLMLLKLFSRQMPPEAMKELNRLLVEFYDNLVQMELEKLQATKPICWAIL